MKRLLLKTHSAIIPVDLPIGQHLQLLQCLPVHSVFLSLVFLLLSLLQTGCESRRSVTGILVLGVENLRPEDIQCGAALSDDFRGFNFLCQEFVRVNGMVANSTSSLPNAASLLTSLNPEHHGLRNNQGFLSSERVLLPEKLALRNWKTGFLSGAPPLVRRANLDQGFQSFDESIPGSPKVPFRSFEQSAQLALNWLQEPDTKKFFLMLSVSDLLYPDYPGVSDKGDDRAKSFDAALEELDETLFHFIEDLKRKKLWDRMWVLVVGLNARPEENPGHYPASLQLGPAQMQVPLFIKGRGDGFQGTGSFKGVWSHTQLGQFVEELSQEIERKSASDGSWPEYQQALTDLSVSFVRSEACDFKDEVLPCRYAYFDQTTWLAWQDPLRLDVSSRRELYQKIQDQLKEPPPPRRPIHMPQPAKIEVWKACMDAFEDRASLGSLNNCPSKSVHFLYELGQQKKAVDGKPENLREAKLRFLHDWTLLRTSRRLYSRFGETGFFPDMMTAPLEELATLEKILERPEFSDVRREAQRVSPL